MVKVVMGDGERRNGVHNPTKKSSNWHRKPDSLHVTAGDEEDM